MRHHFGRRTSRTQMRFVGGCLLVTIPPVSCWINIIIINSSSISTIMSHRCYLMIRYRHQRSRHRQQLHPHSWSQLIAVEFRQMRPRSYLRLFALVNAVQHHLRRRPLSKFRLQIASVSYTHCQFTSLGFLYITRPHLILPFCCSSHVGQLEN